jgi:hypothetical protein
VICLGFESFEVLIDSYLTWLHSVHPDWQWRAVALTEDRGVHGAALPEPVTAQDFEPQFHEILRDLGSRNWANLTAVGAREGILVLAIEYIPGGPSHHPPERISVNWSG